MWETSVTLVGNVATEPRVLRRDDGTMITSFRIGCTSRRFDRAQRSWVDGGTTWATVTCWRALAENVAGSVRKGQRVLVSGRLSTRDWTAPDGRQGTSVDVTADTVGHDLSMGTAQWQRKVRHEQVDVDAAELRQAVEAQAREDLAREDLDADELDALGLEEAPAQVAAPVG